MGQGLGNCRRDVLGYGREFRFIRWLTQIDYICGRQPLESLVLAGGFDNCSRITSTSRDILRHSREVIIVRRSAQIHCNCMVKGCRPRVLPSQLIAQ